MKKSYKKLMFSAIAVVIALPLISMAAGNEISLPERGKKVSEQKREFVGNFDGSQVNKEEMFLQRESRRLENRTKHTEMMEVLEAGDYNAWLEFVKDKDCLMTSQVNEENFSEFVEMHKLQMENRGNGFGGKNKR